MCMYIEGEREKERARREREREPQAEQPNSGVEKVRRWEKLHVEFSTCCYLLFSVRFSHYGKPSVDALMLKFLEIILLSRKDLSRCDFSPIYRGKAACGVFIGLLSFLLHAKFLEIYLLSQKVLSRCDF